MKNGMWTISIWLLFFLISHCKQCGTLQMHRVELKAEIMEIHFTSHVYFFIRFIIMIILFVLLRHLFLFIFLCLSLCIFSQTLRTSTCDLAIYILFAPTHHLFGLWRIWDSIVYIYSFSIHKRVFFFFSQSLCLLFLQLDLWILGVCAHKSNDDDDDVVGVLCCAKQVCMRVNMSTPVVYFYAMTIQYENE